MSSIRRVAQISSHLIRGHLSAPLPTLKTSLDGNGSISSSLSRNFTSSASPETRVTKKDRAFYPYALDIQSRWADNDQYGHLNNAHYYSLFDTVINTFLIQEAGLDPHSEMQGSAIGVVAESGCQYFSSVSFPDMIEARLAVVKLGRSSVVYQVGIFKKLSAEVASELKLVRSSSASAGVFSGTDSAGHNPSLVVDSSPSSFHPSQIQADAAASGHFCHVFVDKISRRPVPIPNKIREGLERLQVAHQP
ncbi:hypothetical protein BGW38_008758 [Lunasporangiospora selenospora]|uniref:Thioesterase domain-containing protein n=1 Tax=Lunasporangiospora selenospora TaxID=979761 RepID=A0A9P6FYA2_9FUNG|nr:hypothetical protein BGW38_008758 [Lunasporangiospora selenospora]